MPTVLTSNCGSKFFQQPKFSNEGTSETSQFVKYFENSDSRKEITHEITGYFLFPKKHRYINFP